MPLPDAGPGTLDKYAPINGGGCLVTMRQRKGTRNEDGRAIFENHNNPYQFDKTTLMRQLCVEERIGRRRYAEDVQAAEEGFGHLVGQQPPPNPGGSPQFGRTLSARSHSEPSLSARRREPGFEAMHPAYTGRSHPLPLGTRPRGRATANSVLSIPTNTPGYQGYIEAMTAENVYGYRHAKLNAVCRNYRLGPGRTYDGISGYIPPPIAFQGIKSARSRSAR
jgi:hypothetical protein